MKKISFWPFANNYIDYLHTESVYAGAGNEVTLWDLWVILLFILLWVIFIGTSRKKSQYIYYEECTTIGNTIVSTLSW